MEREREENVIILVVIVVEVAFLFYEALRNAFSIVLNCTMTD